MVFRDLRAPETIGMADPTKIAKNLKRLTGALSGEGPTIMVPDTRTRMRLDEVANTHGAAAAERLVRAQDEGANISYYAPDALLHITDPQRVQRMGVIDPKTFQDFAYVIDPMFLKSKPYRLADAFDRSGATGSLDDVLKQYAQVAKEGRWDEVPKLTVDTDRRIKALGQYGTDNTIFDYPEIVEHNGRHRMMTQARALRDKKALVNFEAENPDDYAMMSPGKAMRRFGDKIEGGFMQRVIPQGVYDRPKLTEDTLPVIPPTWAKGGSVDDSVPHFDRGGSLAKGIGALSNKIRTYVGSPHKFDKFDPEAIGSGEGSAAFGHGFYSAENPDVAEEYRRITRGKTDSPGVWAKHGVQDDLRTQSLFESLLPDYFPNISDPANIASEILRRSVYGERPNDTARILGIKGRSGNDGDDLQRMLNALPPGYAKSKPGYRYTLDLNAPTENFLDWDAPLSSRANARIWESLSPKVREAVDEHADYQGLAPPSFAPEDYTGHNLHTLLMQGGPQEAMPINLPMSSWNDYTTEKKHLAAYLSTLDTPGIRYLDQFSRPRHPRYDEMVEPTRNYVMFPQSSDLIDIVKREKAEGGRIESFREGGQPDDAPKGALSAAVLAGTNPLPFVKFFKDLHSEMAPEVQRAIDRIREYTSGSGNEAVISGRYGVPKPYTSKMTTGDATSIKPPDTLKNLWTDAPGQPWSVHSHPSSRVFDEPNIPHSVMPSAGDVNNLLLPRSMYAYLNKNLPEMVITNEEGNLIRIGGVHHALDDQRKYRGAKDTDTYIRNLLTPTDIFGMPGMPHQESLAAKYDAIDDWAKANGVNFQRLVNREIKHPTDPDVKRKRPELYNPAGHDLSAAPTYNRLGQMGIPVELSGKFASDPRVDLGDAMKSWASYLEGKTGESLSSADPMQMKFDFSKAEGGMIPHFDRIGSVAKGIAAAAKEGKGALRGFNRTKRAEEILEEERRLNAARGADEPAVSMPPDPRLQTVTGALRTAYPGIYKDPQDILNDISTGSGRFLPESEAMKLLFGTSRRDLDDISQGRDYSNLLLQPHAYYPKPGATGASVSEQVLNPRNMNRLLDIYGEASKNPDVMTTRSWYEMQPLWDRMRALGMDEDYMRKFNTRVGLHSAGASPVSEINRGTLANKMIEEGRLDEYLLFGGVPEKKRASTPGFPADMSGAPSHAYHSTAHTPGLINLEASGRLWTDKHKVPTYVQATDPILADPRRPIADSHLSRGVGYPDVRTSQTEGSLYKELSTPEYGDFVPWWQQLSEKVGEQPRDLQALMWNVLGPQTGVRYIGPPKLEMLSDQIMKASRRLGVTPETARDLVLTGKEGAYAEGGRTGDDDFSFMIPPDQGAQASEARGALSNRYVSRAEQLRASAERNEEIEKQARANPGKYWGELAMNVPRGVANISKMLGIPGSILEDFDVNPGLPTMHGIDEFLDTIVPKPTTHGGTAGRELGDALTGLFGYKGLDMVRPAAKAGASLLRRAGRATGEGFNRLGNALNIGTTLMVPGGDEHAHAGGGPVGSSDWNSGALSRTGFADGGGVPGNPWGDAGNVPFMGIKGGMAQPDDWTKTIIPGATDDYGTTPFMPGRQQNHLPTPLLPPPQAGGGGGGGGGGGLGDIFSIGMKLAPMLMSGGAGAGVMAGSGSVFAEGGSVDDDMQAYHTMFYNGGGAVEPPGYFGGGGVWGDMAGGMGSSSGMPWMSLLNSALSLGKHIEGGQGQLEQQSGEYPFDPASGLWQGIDNDKVNYDQGELIGSDIGKGVGSVVGSFFGPFAPAFTEGLGRLGGGIGAMVQGRFGEGLGNLIEGTPFDALFQSKARGGAVDRFATGGAVPDYAQAMSVLTPQNWAGGAPTPQVGAAPPAFGQATADPAAGGQPPDAGSFLMRALSMMMPGWGQDDGVSSAPSPGYGPDVNNYAGPSSAPPPPPTTAPTGGVLSSMATAGLPQGAQGPQAVTASATGGGIGSGLGGALGGMGGGGMGGGGIGGANLPLSGSINIQGGF